MNIVGTWKLQSFTTEYLDNGQLDEPFGAHPSGYICYGADARMYVIVAGEGRRRPLAAPTEREKAVLFDGSAAYAGTYAIDGDTVRHYVDISWNEAWTGTTQVRTFKIVGNTLHIRSMPDTNPRDGRQSSSTVVWTRVE